MDFSKSVLIELAMIQGFLLLTTGRDLLAPHAHVPLQVEVHPAVPVHCDYRCTHLCARHERTHYTCPAFSVELYGFSIVLGIVLGCTGPSIGSLGCSEQKTPPSPHP